MEQADQQQKVAAVHGQPVHAVARQWRDREVSRRDRSGEGSESLETSMLSESARVVANINMSALTDMFHLPGGQKSKHSGRTKIILTDAAKARAHTSEGDIENQNAEKSRWVVPKGEGVRGTNPTLMNPSSRRNDEADRVDLGLEPRGAAGKKRQIIAIGSNETSERQRRGGE